MSIWLLNFVLSGYNFFFDNITLKATSYWKSACPTMVELTLFDHISSISGSKRNAFYFLEHSAPPIGDLNFKHPYLGNRWAKFEYFFLLFLDFCSE